MNRFLVIVMASAFILGGCASSKVHRGVVAMKMDDNMAHVGIGKGEVSVGDHVQLYANRCTKKSKDFDGNCQKIAKGHGKVVSVLGDDYASVKFDDGVVFGEGDFIEKHNH